jgi:hypothetical protein
MPRFRWVLGVLVPGLAAALVGVVPVGASAVAARKGCRATAFRHQRRQWHGVDDRRVTRAKAPPTSASVGSGTAQGPIA